MGGGEKLEFWRSFFRDLEHDLWTVIDRGIAIAAADYPDKLRERRDGIAEKLFQQIACPAGPIEEEEEEAAVLRGSVSRHSEISPAITACDHEYGNSVMDMGSGNREGDVKEVFKIKKELVDLDKNDDDILELLVRLTDLNLSIETLKATEIGKPVNNLRRHGCDQIKSAARKLIRSWKAVADEWAKSLDDVQGNDEQCTPAPPPIDEDELFATTFEMTKLIDLMDNSMDNNMATGCSISADESPLNSSSRASHSPMPVSPFYNNSGDHFRPSGLKHARKDERKPPMLDAPFHRKKERPQQQSRRESGHPENDKLAAAKRKLQEGYQRAETAKKNRTVQVMDLMDLPKGTGGPKAVKRAPGGTNNSNNKPPHGLPHRR
ncbi:hypothetical protein SELMODRAFT_404483 [Selaginella moellendorffii]|uniref:TFIIS N-terminal domain-containing protein n=1 Tax=Selaginella moellendorffii TaxID=88036 RepID=D8QVH2_SELML|nr:probable mediator of RNA polymerase II transcription subunit 26c [Selaginella moellendorffii]EFJ36459.1 hypothetical protein SELMODRAFT_404483 [Selaginella moellendorffii]|eukprot:XP_002962996.1 probable mediator of RNA polymerase II transcription subunit 26c [Selaginella moellendorffii]